MAQLQKIINIYSHYGEFLYSNRFFQKLSSERLSERHERIELRKINSIRYLSDFRNILKINNNIKLFINFYSKINIFSIIKSI